MRILAVGDLVGQAGLKKFEQEYQKIKENEKCQGRKRRQKDL